MVVLTAAQLLATRDLAGRTSCATLHNQLIRRVGDTEEGLSIVNET